MTDPSDPVDPSGPGDPSERGGPASPSALADDALYHLATVDDWVAHGAAGEIRPASLADEGFVHCSWGRQVPGTVTKHFPGRPDLLALRLDPERLTFPLVEEDSYGSGQAFPHVYGPIPTDAVVEVVSLDAT